MDIKEIVNLLYAAIDLAADGGPEAFTEEEYSEMHELLKKIKSGQFGWHPASEPPVIPKGKFSVSVIAYCNTPSGIYAPVEIAYTRTGGWQYESVKWWCYPPQND